MFEQYRVLAGRDPEGKPIYGVTSGAYKSKEVNKYLWENHKAFKLTRLQRNTLEAKAKGEKLPEIAKRLGLTAWQIKHLWPDTVHQCLQQIWQKTP